jgi:NADH-quinone oxidoreductase subunit B
MPPDGAFIVRRPARLTHRFEDAPTDQTRLETPYACFCQRTEAVVLSRSCINGEVLGIIRQSSLEIQRTIMFSQGFFTSQLEKAIGWARKYSLFQYPFVTACCGMEYMATASSHYDIDRFGAGFPRFSPRQADVLFVVGTINHKMAPVLKTIYDQMCEPKWVVAFGVCTCTGGFYDNYATVQGIDTIIPVDIYIPGCPPRPETVLDGLMKLQERIQHSRQEF